jgi:hypothetical protein
VVAGGAARCVGPEKALMRNGARIQIGMTEPQVRATMAGFPSGKLSYYPTGRRGLTRELEGLTFCADDVCDTTAEVDFVAGQVVRVWFDTD